MIIPIFSVRSRINQNLDALSDRFLEELGRALGAQLQLRGAEEIASADPCVVYIASGGSEMAFQSLMREMPAGRIYLLTSGDSNSLAASMEILSYLRKEGRKGEILHGDTGRIARRLGAIVRAGQARDRLSGMRLGLAGAPSDWLIASRTDRAALSEKLGMETVEISMEELLAEYELHTYEPNEWTERLHACAFDAAEREKALHVYGAFDRLVRRYGLGGLSVRCFDLLTSIKTTGCLGLSILNARGIYGGCEGDMPSLVSMAILGEVSGEPVFLCNPSRIDLVRGDMVLAHCTLPLNMPYRMQLQTHFESDIGVAIAGAIPEGAATVFKAAGDLSEYYAAAGTIKENLTEPTLCRSQIRVKLPDYTYFLERPISNHHLICCGDHTDALHSLMERII